ncbi:hypothetical protein ACH4S8_30720 [Streptomyces sp. NPDC021080]|uniref:hypothetical protein n=1 Tax=Streptomyces sp. NPDC021080 TaxID=3365110 RepID=UPI003789DBF8
MSFSHYPVNRSAALPSEEHLTADGPELGKLRRLAARSRRRFVIANGAVFALALLIDCSSDGLPAWQIAGTLTLGMGLGLLQAVLLLVTAWRYDRFSTQRCDTRAKILRARADTARGQGGLHAWGRSRPVDPTGWTGTTW